MAPQTAQQPQDAEYRAANKYAAPAQQNRPSRSSRDPKLDRFQLPARYEITQVIGSGAYGTVCEAHDTETGQLVAVKRMGHLFKDLVDCKRILREVAIMQHLRHESIVQIYDIPEPSNPMTFQELYVVMEICDSDMKKLLKANVTLSALHINTLLYNLLVGLKYLHSAGIYHRDLKPANCLVNQDCTVKICDFGLSRAVGDGHIQELPDSARLSHDANGKLMPGHLKRHLTGHVVTRWYRAPELILLQENYTEAIDIWSVGCIYAELLGMLHGTDYDNRGPLFPGASCFPLSPDRAHRNDYKFHTRGQHDQLSMIFSLLGKPTQDEMDESNFTFDARRYINCFDARTGQGIQRRFAHADHDARDLLEQMLQFNPAKRTSVNQALEHRLFYEDTSRGTPMIKNPLREVTRHGPVTLKFEEEDTLDEAKLRYLFCEQIRKVQRRNRELDCIKK